MKTLYNLNYKGAYQKNFKGDNKKEGSDLSLYCANTYLVAFTAFKA